jgi:hypothetical protein
MYGAKMQFATQNNSPPLAAKQCTEIQKITGSVLYYSRAVYPTVLMALNDIATEQTTATEKTKTAAGQLLDYLATHPDVRIRFQASDMILHIPVHLKGKKQIRGPLLIRVQSTQSRKSQWLHPESRFSHQKRRGICCRM